MKQIRRSIHKQGGWVQLAAAAIGAGAALSGSKKSSSAAKNAAATQAGATDRATQAQERAYQQTRSDLQPFRKAGQDQIEPLSGLVDQQQKLATDPNAQASFITDNPFFTALADNAQQRLLSNAAAKGKVGSGGTAEAMQNSLLLLGRDLLDAQLNRGNQVINQRQGILQLGQNAAAGQGSAAMSAGQTIADLATQRGNATAAGQVGSANAWSQGINSAINAGLGAYDIYNQGRTGTINDLGFIDTSMLPQKRPIQL